MSREGPPRNPQAPRTEGRVSQRSSTFRLRGAPEHFVAPALSRLRRHMFHPSVKTVRGENYHTGESDVHMWFKAADGQNRRVGAGGLASEVIRNLEGFSS